MLFFACMEYSKNAATASHSSLIFGMMCLCINLIHLLESIYTGKPDVQYY